MRELQLDEFRNYRFLSGVEYAPGGKAAAFVVSQADMDENAYESSIYLYENGEIRRLTGQGKESGYTWLDSHRLLFPAVRSPAEKKRSEAMEPFTAYYVIDIHGGEAVPFMTLPFAARSLKVLDETHFAVTGMIDVNCPDYYKLPEEDQKKTLKAFADDKDYEVLDESPFWFNGAGFVNKKRSALFLVTLKDGKADIERISAPTENVSQVEILGNEALYTLADYTVRRSRVGFRVDAVEWRTGQKRTVTEQKTLEGGMIAVADGIVYLAATDGCRHGLNENAWVYLLNPKTGALTLIRKEEYSMYGSVGSDCRYGGGREARTKGDALYHVTTREGDAVLYRLEADGKSSPVLLKPGSIDEFALTEAHDTVLLIALYDMKLQELYSFENGQVRQLSHFNDDVLNDVYVASPEFIETQSEGYMIGGWVLKPKDFDPGKKYPAVLDIHGGPKTVYGPVFYHEMQFWANQGYFVFFCNPKGSDGRDSAFMDIRGEYGKTDFENIMDFTDAVLEAYPQIDEKRICETGGSYGGFMTNWIIGHTDRFCCAASQRSISNWLSFYGVSDIGPHFAADQTAGDPFESPEKLWEQSPLNYAKNVKTPTLFIHSDQDYRCPLEQGLQMYTALIMNGVPARLCLFHGENHELSRSGKPKHRIRRLKEITDWFAKYAK